jgi:hypothetical protein
MLTPEQEKEVKDCLEGIVVRVASLRMVEPFWRLLTIEHRRQFEDFGALVNACRRSLPGPVFKPPS